MSEARVTVNGKKHVLQLDGRESISYEEIVACSGIPGHPAVVMSLSRWMGQVISPGQFVTVNSEMSFTVRSKGLAPPSPGEQRRDS